MDTWHYLVEQVIDLAFFLLQAAIVCAGADYCFEKGIKAFFTQRFINTIALDQFKQHGKIDAEKIAEIFANMN